MSVEVLDDPYAQIRNALRIMAAERNDYSGCPIPLPEMPLVIEPTYKYKGLESIYDDPKDDEPTDFKIRNIFWSRRLHMRIAICEQPEGCFWAAPFEGSSNAATALMKTVGASDVWGVEQEAAAIDTLGTMLRHRQFKQYLLTGSFLERSVKSGVMYMFRRLRPTLAIRDLDRVRVLCGMCMHPIGYYEGCWAGCMCPTDDVIAHLILMRGDEKMFWRRCNQHPAYDSACGLS